MKKKIIGLCVFVLFISIVFVGCTNEQNYGEKGAFEEVVSFIKENADYISDEGDYYNFTYYEGEDISCDIVYNNKDISIVCRMDPEYNSEMHIYLRIGKDPNENYKASAQWIYYRDYYYIFGKLYQHLTNDTYTVVIAESNDAPYPVQKQFESVYEKGVEFCVTQFRSFLSEYNFSCTMQDFGFES